MERNYTIPIARKSFVTLGVLGSMAAIGAGILFYGVIAITNVARNNNDIKESEATIMNYASRLEKAIEEASR